MRDMHHSFPRWRRGEIQALLIPKWICDASEPHGHFAGVTSITASPTRSTYDQTHPTLPKWEKWFRSRVKPVEEFS